MSIKKATPKAVFDACEQLELLDKAWNRDDVRMIIGGGSFVVIDPLIQAWRKLQPVRKVAPTVPTELLIQVASMLEKQMADFIGTVEQQDKEREEILLSLNKSASESFELRESQLEAELELARHANHELEAEFSRKDTELVNCRQEIQALQLKLQVSSEAAVSLNVRLQEQKEFYEHAIEEQKQATTSDKERTAEQHLLTINEIKLDAQQQLAQQKNALTESAEIAENRLMRLLDQSRSEQKQLVGELTKKTESLSHDLQGERQICHGQKLEIASLTSALNETKENLQAHKEEQAEAFTLRLAALQAENDDLKEQVAGFKDKDGVRELSDIQQLRESIKQLQDRVLGDS